MAEAEAVVAWKLRPVRTDQLLPDKRRERRHHLLIARKRLHSAAVEDLTLHRTTLEHGSLRPLELVEPRSEQRLQRRRHGHLSLRRRNHRHHFVHEEGIATGRADDAIPQIRRERLRQKLLHRILREWLQP